MNHILILESVFESEASHAIFYQSYSSYDDSFFLLHPSCISFSGFDGAAVILEQPVHLSASISRDIFYPFIIPQPFLLSLSHVCHEDKKTGKLGEVE